MDLLVLGRRYAFRWFGPSLIGIECRVDGILLCQEVCLHFGFSLT